MLYQGGTRLFLFFPLTFLLSSCTVSPVTGIEDSELESWRVESEFSIIRSIEFSSNGDLMLITGEAETSESGNVEIWDTDNWELIQTLETERAYNLNAYFLSEDNKEILVVSASGKVSVFHTETGIKEKILVEGLEQDSVALPVDFSTSQQLLSLSSPEGILLLNTNTGEEYVLPLVANNNYWWQSIAFSEDGAYLALLTSPQDDNNNLPSIVHIFDVETQVKISSIEISSHSVIDIVFINNRYFALSGVDGFLEIRDFETGEVVKDLSLKTPLRYNSLARARINSMPESTFFAVGSNAATGTYSVVGEITLWSADSAEPLCSTGKMSDTAFVNPAVAISPDGQYLAGVAGGDVVVWNTEPCFQR